MSSIEWSTTEPSEIIGKKAMINKYYAKWNKITSEGPVPPGRSGHSCDVIQNRYA